MSNVNHKLTTLNEWVDTIAHEKAFIYGFVTKSLNMPFDDLLDTNENTQVCYEWGRQFSIYCKNKLQLSVAINDIPNDLDTYKPFIINAIKDNYINCKENY